MQKFDCFEICNMISLRKYWILKHVNKGLCAFDHSVDFQDNEKTRDIQGLVEGKNIKWLWGSC